MIYFVKNTVLIALFWGANEGKNLFLKNGITAVVADKADIQFLERSNQC